MSELAAAAARLQEVARAVAALAGDERLLVRVPPEPWELTLAGRPVDEAELVALEQRWRRPWPADYRAWLGEVGALRAWEVARRGMEVWLSEPPAVGLPALDLQLVKEPSTAFTRWMLAYLTARRAELAHALEVARADAARLARLPAKLARLGTYGEPSAPPADEAELVRREAAVHVRLPAGYRAFLTRLGDGGPCGLEAFDPDAVRRGADLRPDVEIFARGEHWVYLVLADGTVHEEVNGEDLDTGESFLAWYERQVDGALRTHDRVAVGVRDLPRRVSATPPRERLELALGLGFAHGDRVAELVDGLDGLALGEDERFLFFLVLDRLVVLAGGDAQLVLIERMMHLVSTSRRARWHAGRHAEAAGRLDEAQRRYREAGGVFAVEAARIHWEAGRPADARAELDASGADLAVVHADAAACSLRLGDVAAAEASLWRWLECGGDRREVMRALTRLAEQAGEASRAGVLAHFADEPGEPQPFDLRWRDPDPRQLARADDAAFACDTAGLRDRFG